MIISTYAEKVFGKIPIHDNPQQVISEWEFSQPGK